MPRHDWNDYYASNDLPWDVGEPDAQLVELVAAGRVKCGRALEVGCGTGTNAIWLAEQGFDVLGVDVSPRAIERASAKRPETMTTCRFAALDFLRDEVSGGPFDFVFDRGCFHVFHEAAERASFARRVASVLAPNGLWLSLIGSTEGPPRDSGPPRRTAREVVDAIEPVLEIRELRGMTFHTHLPERAAAWLCVSGRRAAPAQPSTKG